MKRRFVRISFLLSTGLVSLQLWAGQLNQNGQAVVYWGSHRHILCPEQITRRDDEGK